MSNSLFKDPWKQIYEKAIEQSYKEGYEDFYSNKAYNQKKWGFETAGKSYASGWRKAQQDRDFKNDHNLNLDI